MNETDPGYQASASPEPLTLDQLRCLARCAADRANDADLDRAVDLAASPSTAATVLANRIGPLLVRSLRRADPGRRLPSALGDRARTAALSGLAAQAALGAISRRFSAAGIPWLAWKGPALAVQAWDLVSAREFDDLDIVVHRADRDRALKSLASDGWGRRGGVGPEQQRWIQGGTGAFDLAPVAAVAPAGNTVPSTSATASDPAPGQATPLLELHWRFASARFPPGPSVEEVLGRATTLSLGDLELPTPAIADALLLAALHGAKHGWSQLEEIVTFDRLHSIAPEAAVEASARSMRCGLGGAWRLAIDVRLDLFGGGVPRRPEIVDRLCRGDAGWRPDHSWSLSWMTRDRDRMRYWAHALLAPTREEWKWVRLPGALAWLYPAVRLARLAVRR